MFIAAGVVWLIVVAMWVAFALGWKPEATMRVGGTNIKWKSEFAGTVSVVFMWYALVAVALLLTVIAGAQWLWRLLI